MIDCLLRCIRFILGPVILSVGKECQIAERMYIFACETRDCGARRLRSNMFYRYIIIVDNGSLLWCWYSNRTISVPFDMLVQGAEQITQRFIATVCSILEVRKPDLKYSISTFASFPKKQCDHAPFSVWNANCSKIHAYLCFHLQRFEFP